MSLDDGKTKRSNIFPLADRDLRKTQMQAELYVLHPEYFEPFGLDVKLTTEHAVHVISLHAGVWRCTCAFSLGTCGHILAVQKLLSSAFDSNGR